MLDANRLNHVSGTKLADDVEALERRTKDGIPIIEHVLRTKAEVELRTGGVGVLGTGHRKRAVHVAVARVRVVLVLDTVARATRTRHAVTTGAPRGNLLGRHVSRVGAAALDDESGNVAVELEVIVEAAAGKLAEVRDVDGGTLAVQTNANRALGRRENGDLVALDFVLGGVEGSGMPNM